MLTFRNFANHAELLLCAVLFAPADASGSGSVRDDRRRTDGATDEPEADPYARKDVDWEVFNATLAKNLDTAGYASKHLGKLISSALTAMESFDEKPNIHYTETIAATPDELADNPFLALFGPMPQDIKIVPHDPDVPSTFRAIADALDAAWMATTGRVSREQPNATFRG